MERKGFDNSNCRSETGVTVMLIDSMIATARVLVERDWSPSEVQEALKDIRQDDDLHRIMNMGDLDSLRDVLDDKDRSIRALLLVIDLQKEIHLKELNNGKNNAVAPERVLEILAEMVSEQKKKTKEVQPLIVVMPGTNKAYFNPF